MNIKKLNEEILNLLYDINLDLICPVYVKVKEVRLDELPDNGDEYIDFNDAMTKIIDYYFEDKLNVWYKDVLPYTFNGQTFYLSLVMGSVIYENNKLYCKYGIKHIFDKHGKEQNEQVNVSLSSNETLKNMLYKLPEAIQKGKIFKCDRYKDKLYIYYNNYLYILCEKQNDKEVTYLHNLFKANKQYIKRLRKRT